MLLLYINLFKWSDNYFILSSKYNISTYMFQYRKLSSNNQYSHTYHIHLLKNNQYVHVNYNIYVYINIGNLKFTITMFTFEIRHIWLLIKI